MRDSATAEVPQAETARTEPPNSPNETPAASVQLAARLVAISALSLFLEMALIRFINATVQVIAYFNNFVILATFLGLGFGALWSRRWPRLFSHTPWLLTGLLGVLIALDRVATAREDIPELVVWTPYQADETFAFSSVLLVTFVFVACFALFVPLGCELGQRLEAFQDRLVAYGYDLLGSIAGVLAFALVSWGRYPPWVWFGLISLGLGVLFWAAGISLRWRAIVLGLGVALSVFASDGYYSPYYKVQLEAFFRQGADKPTHYSVVVDKLRIQDAIDFDQDLSNSPLAPWVPYYELPYALRPAPERVLVLGGGSGNDTVFALKAGAKHVTTVEVDPVLVDFGHHLHPQRPYGDPRVTAVNDDARAFLRRTSETYDLIVMNALDSHKQVPGLSTLRLESYIYTVQAFEDVRRHMGPDSIFIVHLSSSRPWMGERLYWSLTAAFGREPVLMTAPDSPFNSFAFVYGPPKLFAQKGGAAAEHFRAVRATTTLATDDWPHLYLAEKRIPTLYFEVLAAVIVLTLVCFRTVGVGGSGGALGLLHFALLGASFMLLETRAITQFALLFGSTWFVNAIVVSAILIVVYLGNRLLQTRASLPKPAVYAALLASLLALYFVPLDALLPLNFGLRVLAAGLVIGAPVFAASLIFSESFRRAPDAAAAFGANLVGVVIGGALEYSSMQIGLKALYLLAAVMYVASFVVERLAAARSVGAANRQQP